MKNQSRPNPAVRRQNDETTDRTPEKVTLKITGSESSLIFIASLLSELAKITGASADGSGSFYIPLSLLTRVLVGTDDCTGNLLSWRKEGEAVVLCVDCEEDCPELALAFIETVSDIRITVAEN